MNRKNIILIAVLINACLLVVLFIAATTTNDELVPATQMASQKQLQLPKFEEKLQVSEVPIPLLPEFEKPVETPLTVVDEPFVHKLPQLVPDATLAQTQVQTPPAQPVRPTPPQVGAASINEIVVKKGDTLEKIAKANQVSVQDLLSLNQLTSTFLKIGQVLKIPVEKTVPKSVQKPQELGPEYYTMKVGENPWAIAMKHHMKVDELLRLNGLNEEKARKLKPGDRLRIR